MASNLYCLRQTLGELKRSHCCSGCSCCSTALISFSGLTDHLLHPTRPLTSCAECVTFSMFPSCCITRLLSCNLGEVEEGPVRGKAPLHTQWWFLEQQRPRPIANGFVYVFRTPLGILWSACVPVPMTSSRATCSNAPEEKQKHGRGNTVLLISSIRRQDFIVAERFQQQTDGLYLQQ